jgi:H/ACA ribonucleoprotein complex subunit 4
MEKTKELLRCSFINLDKPVGPTSHQISCWIKKILDVEIVGHAGTLDPAVGGVLPILIGKATRLSRYFLQDKEYVGIARLHKNIGLKDLENVIKKEFTGKIKQLPPKKSAVARKIREKQIYFFRILEKKDKNALFHVKCEAGTYIRKLIDDLGQKIGGAHMLELRRIRDGIFNEKNSVTMHQLIDAVRKHKKGSSEELEKILIPVEIIAKNMPKIIVKKEFIAKVYHGSPIFKKIVGKKDKMKEGDIVAVICGKKLIEIARAIFQKEIVAKPETVLIRD